MASNNHTGRQPAGRLIGRSGNRTIGQPTNHTTGHMISRTIGRKTCQATDEVGVASYTVCGHKPTAGFRAMARKNDPSAEGW